MHTRAKGRQAELLAINFLQQKGFQILEQDSHQRIGEIDIVAQDGAELVFVEVKSVAVDKGISPLEMISQLKKHRIEQAINMWLLKHDKLQSKWRFDFVGLLLTAEGAVIDIIHLANAEL